MTTNKELIFVNDPISMLAGLPDDGGGGLTATPTETIKIQGGDAGAAI